jgi:ADP-ribosylglycohydrolase
MSASLLTYGDRVRGCLLGGALGDALGAGVEFSTLDEIRARHGPDGVTGLVPAYGVFAPLTDDTQMTLFTAEALIRTSVHARTEGECDPKIVLWRAYLRWLATQHREGPPEGPDGWLAGRRLLYARRAPGNACLSGLARETMGTRADPSNPDSKGCEAVMRSAPFGLLPTTAEACWDMAVDGAVLTHGHPSGYLAAAAFAWIVDGVTAGAAAADATLSAIERVSAEPRSDEVVDALRVAVDLADRGAPTPRRVAVIGEGWVAEQALAIAVYCALAADGDPVAALLAAVNHSGDSDSTGAICGNLVGAAVGEPGLPSIWTKQLEGYELVSELADDLVQELSAPHEVADADGAATPGWWRRYPGA